MRTRPSVVTFFSPAMHVVLGIPHNVWPTPISWKVLIVGVIKPANIRKSSERRKSFLQGPHDGFTYFYCCGQTCDELFSASGTLSFPLLTRRRHIHKGNRINKDKKRLSSFECNPAVGTKRYMRGQSLKH